MPAQYGGQRQPLHHPWGMGQSGRGVAGTLDAQALQSNQDNGGFWSDKMATADLARLEADSSHIKTGVSDLKKSVSSIEATVNSIDKNMAVIMVKLDGITNDLSKKPSTDAVDKKISDAKLSQIIWTISSVLAIVSIASGIIIKTLHV
ncbi:hypothetical protein [Pectobacterium parmentieri]|uniref:hypothetical protein n=1 Tax=Pectobacterium parmentieri TaxID=1905730 RepID=UPI001E61E8A3|nr:hypothetical protein [Pectobacterium parmentieri]